ncbi:hypothetical protein [Paenibacillus agricola]|uniref:Uncharacterized protein n=1 Tax=Paenibacillus agricola TaxID=2716264 RepID=A0ABX0JI21_9BACL|nr:hypothetical protein [Paenibacillus agricola]NHN35496.1 hypothetical protein [Paenibacillus agricola]
MYRRASLLLALGLLVGALTNQMAVTAQEATATTGESLTLFETTALRDDHGVEVGSISPQQVRVLQTSSIRRGHGEGYRVPMYLISTWLGDKWIVPDNALKGSEEKFDTYLELSHEERVYEDPGLLSEKGMIGKQTAKVLSRWGGRYKIATSNGERWIAPRWSAVTGVKLIQADIQLKAQTKLFSFPNEYDTGASISPQLMHVTAEWQDWYRADSWLGPVWFQNFEPKKYQLFDTFYLYDAPNDNKWTMAAISPQIVETIDRAPGFYKINTWQGEKWIKVPPIENHYAMTDLAQIQKVDEKINIKTIMNLYKGASLGAMTADAIAPQTVQAFEKIDNWYHIKSDWVGDAWIKVDQVPTK